MEVMGSDRGSDYIANFDFVPPSPPLDPVLEFSAFDPVLITSPPLPHTSGSFNGSYYSPYSQHSELSFSDHDIQLEDFPLPINDYEPSDYDPPNQPSLLMLTNDSDYMSPIFAPNTFDHSSPSSNDDNTHLDESWHSRPSSAASNHPSSPQPPFHTSPRLSVDFGNMSMNTPPGWGTVPLPQHSSSLFQKAQSPPRLSMSDEEQNVPIIHAPNEDANMNGPQFRIVPATPVSGGGAGRTDVPFQTTLSTLTQASESAPSINHQQSSQQQPLQRDASFSGTEENSAISSPSTHTNSATSGFIFPNNYSQPPQQQQHQSRPRTYSDSWNPNFVSSTGSENANVANEAAGAYDFSRRQMQTFTFPSSTLNNGNTYLSPDPLRRSASDGKYHRPSRSEHIRSPFGGHNVSAGYHHQQSHSIGGGSTAASTQFLSPPVVDPHTGLQQQQFFRASQLLPTTHHLGLLSAAGSASNPNLSLSSSSPAIGHFRRPSSTVRSDRGAEAWGSQGHHGMTPRRMSPYPSPNASPRVRYTELELDGGTDNNNGAMGLGMGMGRGDLADPPVSAGFSEEIPLSRRGSYTGLDLAIGGSQKAESIGSGGSQPRSNIPSPSQTDMLPSQIPKVNVTTGRTANASHRRRKQEANFACTVPGCGSTFTRGFNLKGHMRSHFELKPYKCHWPGCEKGFARQHDCKRHEQLHSNFRPFECDGCRKQFARMDALNRHLKSDAGVECARLVEGANGAGNSGGYGMAMSMSMGGGMLNMEPEEQKYIIPRTRHGGGGGGVDSWSGVAL